MRFFHENTLATSLLNSQRLSCSCPDHPMPSALILFQYFHPDDVVTASHFTELAEGLVRRGWRVTAMPCNRSCRTAETYPSHGVHRGVTIKRIWRPAFPQNKSWGLIANCLWMLAAWSLKTLTTHETVVIVGTNPILSAAVTVPWKFFRPSRRAVHWCLDLYPEAAVADGILKPGLLFNLLRGIMAVSYRHVDLLADIGDCMGLRLAAYPSSAIRSRLWPWALAEPATVPEADPIQRQTIFGRSHLAIMYSGNFGRAHSFSELLTIARQMRDVDAHFSFCIRGNRVTEVRDAIDSADHNISFGSFVPAEQLEGRLSCADIQVVSLRPEWTGTVVPSKFFGALAAGRPVLFIGSEQCTIAQIIRRYGLGWVCPPGHEASTAWQLRALAQDMSSLRPLQDRCHQVYRKHFSRETVLDAFDKDLRSLWPAQPPKLAKAAPPFAFTNGEGREEREVAVGNAGAIGK
jgi:colanic acid biosynthesis glycosyl transferase WcaI